MFPPDMIISRRNSPSPKHNWSMAADQEDGDPVFGEISVLVTAIQNNLSRFGA